MTCAVLTVSVSRGLEEVYPIRPPAVILCNELLNYPNPEYNNRR
jgi:hypothetical protein